MLLTETEKTRSERSAAKSKAAEVAGVLEELITAFVLAFLVVGFVVQPYIIPTGSMVATLKGDHFHLRCPQCGYKYDHAFVPERYGLPENTFPRGKINPPCSRCPNCGFYHANAAAMPLTKGDKILALKCLYQLFEPRQWDVIVFNNPLSPRINYIKRLVGLPGQTVQIIDGDVYIDGQISRKPPKIQDELWMPVYDNDYQPVRPHEGSFNGHHWQQPLRNVTGSKWRIDKANPTVFSLDGPPAQVNTLIYDTTIGNDFRAVYAYNDPRRYKNMPYSSDLMVRFYAQSTNPQGRVGITLSKYQNRYKAWVDLAGNMVIEAEKPDRRIELARKKIPPPSLSKPTVVKFANVDHLLSFQFGTEKLTHDLGRGLDDAGPRKTTIQPEVKIFGSGRLRICHIAIFRDIHYTAGRFAGSRESTRAVQAGPITLEEDEFFVLGDNSPVSGDSRWWSEPGKGNNGLSYRPGIVPREYLLGKAFVVIWPGGFRPFDKFPFAIIPDAGRLRFIHGGSTKNP